MSIIAKGGAVDELSIAVDKWYIRNVPRPRIALMAPDHIDAVVEDFESSRRPTVRVDKTSGLKILGLEVTPDRRVDPGVIVFVDENFKFVGATVLP